MTQPLSQHAAHAGRCVLLRSGFVPNLRRSFEYVCEFLCHRKNEVGYMAKVGTTRGGRKDTPPGWLGSAAWRLFRKINSLFFSQSWQYMNSYRMLLFFNKNTSNPFCKLIV